MTSTLTLQREDPASNPAWDLSVWSSRMHGSSLGTLASSHGAKNMVNRLVGDFKLSVGEC